jgi:hypothetical protein
MRTQHDRGAMERLLGNIPLFMVMLCWYASVAGCLPAAEQSCAGLQPGAACSVTTTSNVTLDGSCAASSFGLTLLACFPGLPPFAAARACFGPGGSCLTDVDCAGMSGAGKTGACLHGTCYACPRFGTGQPGKTCTYDIDCACGLYCDPMVRVCASIAGAPTITDNNTSTTGSSCSSSSGCDPQYYCSSDTLTTDNAGTCAPNTGRLCATGIGSPCTTSKDCLSGEVCSGPAYCVAPVHPSTSEPCPYLEAFVRNNECFESGQPLGGSCSSDSECVVDGLLCDGALCRVVLACTGDSDCAPGTCNHINTITLTPGGICVAAPGGTGGATGSGGSAGAGGVTGSGGSAGTGGSGDSGGVSGAAGSPSTGGTSGAGGTPGTGGAPSTGGTTGTGGAISTGGATGTGGITSSGGTTGFGGNGGSGGTAGSGGMTCPDGGVIGDGGIPIPCAPPPCGSKGQTCCVSGPNGGCRPGLTCVQGTCG